MSVTVCISARALDFPQGGGHMWAYLNWALGLRSLGCKVLWMEAVNCRNSEEKIESVIADFRRRLEPYGFVNDVLFYGADRQTLPSAIAAQELPIEILRETDLMLNLAYGTPDAIVAMARKSAMLDIDPGLTQIWLSDGVMRVAPHDFYFTIGETVGTPAAKFPNLNVKWHYTPPCVALDWWHVAAADSTAPFTTVSQWISDEYMEDENGWYCNNKRSGFEPFLDLPQLTELPLELALCLAADEDGERRALRARGWRVRHAFEVSSSASDYQRYIAGSRGEFSCAKPSCVRLENAWISDRTLCYLASGRPAIVQHTGKSAFLPDAAGLFRFRTLVEAAGFLERVAGDYEHQCHLARELAEEHFDARKVAASVLERVLN